MLLIPNFDVCEKIGKAVTTQQTFVLVKTYWRRLQCNIFLSSKTSWRRLEHIIARRLANMSWKRLENVLKTSCKTSWRRLEDVLGRRFANMSWRRLGRRKVLRWRRFQDVLKTSWKTRNVCWASKGSFCPFLQLICSNFRLKPCQKS